MFFIALAVDYDGTIARNGRVDAATVVALEEVKKSGRKLILVTGRHVDDLQRVFPELGIFNLVVAENGALLFDPETKEEQLLAAAPADKLIEYLHNKKVTPLSIGRCIVATWEPNETIVLEAIRDLGLEMHIIFNKGAVMVLPAEINKASGLKQALKRLKLSPYNVVAIGDAENDQAFLRSCGCSVAVGNALSTVKENADFVVADHGAGVAELSKLLIETDLSGQQIGVRKIQPVIGESDGVPRRLNPFETVLVTGSSGGGKSTVVTALLEQMIAHDLQFCVIDPEGDYAEFPAVMVGDAKHEPSVSEIMDLLAKPDTSVVVNLLAIDATERPRYLAGLMPELSKLRISTGRPHWIVLDEAHHCLPAEWDPAPVSLPQELPAAIAVTVHPEEVSPDFLKLVSTVVGVGDKAEEVIQHFCAAAGYSCADFSDPLGAGDGVFWTREEGLRKIALLRPQERQKRHVRKYAEGELGEDKSFYFRGPNGSLNLRAHNLAIFLQMAQGVDDQTWTHHLRLGEYSRWFGEAIKDDELAAETRAVEQNEVLSAQESLERIKEIVERRYTAPAKSG